MKVKLTLYFFFVFFSIGDILELIVDEYLVQWSDSYLLLQAFNAQEENSLFLGGAGH